MNDQEPITRSLVRVARTVARGAARPGSALGIAFGIALLMLAGCDAGDARGRTAGSPTAEEDAAGAPADALPELERIGGVQDVWALPFGMNADRETVRAELGDPAAIERPERPEDSGGPMVERWQYEGLVLTFLLDPIGEQEYLLTARIVDEAVLVRGGLRIGMPVDEAVEILGEPRVVDGPSRVYFYRDTTIEIIERDGEVAAIQLARALP